MITHADSHSLGLVEPLKPHKKLLELITLTPPKFHRLEILTKLFKQCPDSDLHAFFGGITLQRGFHGISLRLMTLPAVGIARWGDSTVPPGDHALRSSLHLGKGREVACNPTVGWYGKRLLNPCFGNHHFTGSKSVLGGCIFVGGGSFRHEKCRQKYAHP